MPDESLLSRLSAPFPPATVSWRLGPMNAEKTRGMALAYIDARDVQDRLNEVCGAKWQVRHPWASGTLIACEIGILSEDGEWIWRGDGAGEIENDTGGSGERKEQAQDMARKAAFSDSFKRAAVRWGVGRYLYDIDSPWVEIEARGRSYVIPDRELARLRSLLMRPTAAATQPATSAAASRGHSSTGEPETLSQIRDRIHRALSQTNEKLTPDHILKVNKADLMLIKNASETAYSNLIAYATQRTTMLAERKDNAGPADYEAGSALAQKLREGLVA